MVGVLPKNRIRCLTFLAKALRQAKDVLLTRQIQIVFCISKVHKPFVISIIQLNRFLIKIDYLEYNTVHILQITERCPNFQDPRVHIFMEMQCLVRIYTISNFFNSVDVETSISTTLSSETLFKISVSTLINIKLSKFSWLDDDRILDLINVRVLAFEIHFYIFSQEVNSHNHE